MKRIVIAFSLLLCSILMVSQTCPNLNFESGNLNNWTITSGSPDLFTNYNMTGCCASPGSTAVAVYSTPLADPYFGTLPASPLGGNFVAKVNNINMNGNASRITNTFAVSSNTVFQFAIAGVVDGITESCSSVAYAHIRVLDNTGTPFYSTHYVPVGVNTATCSFAAFTNTINNTAFFCWQTYSVNLAPYVGTNVSVEVSAANCGGWGHWAYCYFDAACSVTTPTPTTCPMVTGIKEITEMKLVTVWPNPANDELNISLQIPDMENEFIVYDVLGKEVMRQKNLKHDTKLDIAKLLPGTYSYKLVTLEETSNGKFIKQ